MRLLCLAIVVALLAPSVEAALCKNGKGALFSRAACKRREVEVDPAAIGAAGPKGDPGSPGAAQPRLRAVDANGQRLPGVVTSRGQFVYRLGTRSFTFTVRPDGLLGGEFFFDAMNCAGPRLVQVTDELYDPVAVVGTTAYYAGDPVQAHATQSELFPSTAQQCVGPGKTYDAATGLCCNGDFSTSISAGPATAADLGSFTLPFRLELEE
jgi:hypothetical protein